MLTFTLAVELLMILLLAVTIGYAALLNKRIQTIDQNKDFFKEILQGFSTSFLAAERTIQTLQQTTHASAEIVQKRQNEINQLRDDLDMLIKRAEKAANDVETAISDARNVPAARHLTPSFSPSVERPTQGSKPQELISLQPEHETHGLDDNSLSDVKEQLIGKLKALR